MKIPAGVELSDAKVEKLYERVFDVTVVGFYHACVAMSTAQGVSITETMTELLSEATATMSIDGDHATVAEAFNRLMWSLMGKSEEEFQNQNFTHGICGLDEVLQEEGV